MIPDSISDRNSQDLTDPDPVRIGNPVDLHKKG